MKGENNCWRGILFIGAALWKLCQSICIWVFCLQLVAHSQGQSQDYATRPKGRCSNCARSTWEIQYKHCWAFFRRLLCPYFPTGLKYGALIISRDWKILTYSHCVIERGGPTLLFYSTMLKMFRLLQNFATVFRTLLFKLSRWNHAISSFTYEPTGNFVAPCTGGGSRC